MAHILNVIVISEEEAKTKECPMAKSSVAVAMGTHCVASALPIEANKCSASRCCIWRPYGPEDKKEGLCGLQSQSKYKENK